MTSTYGQRSQLPQMSGGGGGGNNNSNSISSRLPELLEAVKQEFEQASQDTHVYKLQRDEFEHKISSQISEMTQIHQSVYDLERAHQKMKQQYEDEIMRLRKELEARGGTLPPSNILPNFTAVHQTSTQLNAPNLGTSTGNMSGGGLFNGTAAPMQMSANNAPQANRDSLQQYADSRNKPAQPLSQRAPTTATPASQQPAPSSKALVFGDVDVDTIPATMKKEGSDWLVLFNPKVQRRLDTRLLHSLDHTSVVCCVKFSADGKLLATGCNKNTQIYDVASGNKISTLVDSTVEKEGDLYIRSVCFSPNGTLLATGAEDKQIRVWNVSTGAVQHYFVGHEQDIYSLDFSSDGRFIVSGSGDRASKVWSLETGQCLFTMLPEDSQSKDAGVTSVAISPDGSIIAAGSLDRVIRIWDTQSGKLITRLEGHNDSVYSVAFSPDGKSLVSGSLDKSLKLWDIQQTAGGVSAACRNTLSGHKDFVLSVAFSADGSYVISGSKDRFVQLWDHKTGHPLFMLQGHKNSVISVATSPKGSLFATGSGDCRARIWSVDKL